MGDEWFFGSDIEKVFIPNTVRVLGENAFAYCEKLREVVFEPGSRLNTIKCSCFYGCGLEEVVVPKSVREIEGFAFYYCEHLHSLTFEEGSKLVHVGEQIVYSTPLEQKELKFPSTAQIDNDIKVGVMQLL